MSFVMQQQTEPFGSYSTVDLIGLRASNFKFTAGISHPARLTWEMQVAQHAKPLAYRTFIRFWETGKTDPDGNAFSADNPLFEGFIEEIQPADSFKVIYTAYDPTLKASTDVKVMSIEWNKGDVSEGVFPTEGIGAVPRLVFNSVIDMDDDFAFERAPFQTVGQILSIIFDDQYHPLYWANAAPGDGSDDGNDTAYVTADLIASSTGINYIPQEKIVFESESVRSAVDRMLNYVPRVRMIWIPGTRKWRFYDLFNATARTLTLNDFSGDDKVLSMELHRSIEGRYGAVKIYGPESTVITIASTTDGSLRVYDNNDYKVLEHLGSVEVRAYREWQITDPARRRMSPILPDYAFVPMGNGYFVPTRLPSLQMSWDNGETWVGIQGPVFHYREGRVRTIGFVYIYDSNGRLTPTGIQNYFPPTDVRIVYAYFDTPISVRSPATGFAGTSNTVANLENEWKLYDEMLAVGYVFGTPVTTAFRLAQFQILCDALHAETKDIIYTGGVALDGIRYDYCRLQRRVNIAGVDGDGGSITTGWESIGAVVTDVEYDFESGLTTLQFSSDQAELIGMAPEAMKDRLNIRAMEAGMFISQTNTPFKEWRHTMLGTRYLAAGMHTRLDFGSFFYNAATGFVDASQWMTGGMI